MSTWIVLQSPSSGYNDEPGISYEYPHSIPNGRQIRANDILIVVEPLRITGSTKRLIGWGVVDHVISYERNGRSMANAVYSVYNELSPRLGFEDIGGDPRNNRQNAITGVPPEIEASVLARLASAGSVPRNSSALQLELPLTIAAEPRPAIVDLIQLEARRVRQGQGLFRKDPLVLYEGRCAISDFTPNAVVDAAHIVPYAETSDHDINNGLLLRADLHNLFDDGLLRIEPVRMRVELSKELTRTPYAELAGMPLRPRIDGSFPAIEALDQHYRTHRSR
ncbi:MAG: HNH endonuclease [Flavobacteriales bacterium]|nr:HNH endonuclease [Flavobacteriales bacterium]